MWGWGGNDPRVRGAGGRRVAAAGVVPEATRLRLGRSWRRRHNGTARHIGMLRRIGSAGCRRRRSARRLAGSRRCSRCRDRGCNGRGLAGGCSWWRSFGLHRRRDVFDGGTVGAAAAHGQPLGTNGRHPCRSGLADRPSGRASGACRTAGARTVPRGVPVNAWPTAGAEDCRHALPPRARARLRATRSLAKRRRSSSAGGSSTSKSTSSAISQ